MTETKPTEERPLGSATSATPWEHAQKRLAEADSYWLATIRPDNHPHVRPLLGVWLSESLYFCTGETTRKSKNIENDARCSIAAETDEFHFVVEGNARNVSDEATLSEVAEVYATKYGWEVNVRDGAFYADGAPTAGPPPYDVYELTQTTVFGFSREESVSSTRWRFE